MKPDTPFSIDPLLACPATHRSVRVEEGKIFCPDSDFKGEVRDDVIVVLEQKTFFDDKFGVMQLGHETEHEKKVFYNQQVEFLMKFLEKNSPSDSNQVILDVGCGPGLPYAVNGRSFVIGLDPSFPSIKANKEVAARIAGSAAAIPLVSDSVNVIICFYSIHHMIGSSVEENKEIVGKVFSEFRRVIRKGGYILVFEAAPFFPFSFLQKVFWKSAKKILKNKLDMYFWPAKDLALLGEQKMPSGQLEEISFKIPWFELLPPVFSFPWLKIFRILYPLNLKLYKWKF